MSILWSHLSLQAISSWRKMANLGPNSVNIWDKKSELHWNFIRLEKGWENADTAFYIVADDHCWQCWWFRRFWPQVSLSRHFMLIYQMTFPLCFGIQFSVTKSLSVCVLSTKPSKLLLSLIMWINLCEIVGLHRNCCWKRKSTTFWKKNMNCTSLPTKRYYLSIQEDSLQQQSWWNLVLQTERIWSSFVMH